MTVTVSTQPRRRAPLRTRFNLIVACVVAVLVLGVAVLGVARQRSQTVVPVSLETSTISKPLDNTVTWRPDQWNGRALEKNTRDIIEATYLKAWQTLGGHGEGVASNEVFAGPALANATGGRSGPTVNSLSQGHDLELTFYSMDGTIIGFRDHHARTTRIIASGQGESTLISDEQFDVVFTLEEDTWKLRHFRRLGGSSYLAGNSSLTTEPSMDKPGSGDR